MAGWILDGGFILPEPAAAMDILASILDDIPDARADNARHDFNELLVTALACGVDTRPSRVRKVWNVNLL